MNPSGKTGRRRTLEGTVGRDAAHKCSRIYPKFCVRQVRREDSPRRRARGRVQQPVRRPRSRIPHWFQNQETMISISSVLLLVLLLAAPVARADRGEDSDDEEAAMNGGAVAAQGCTASPLAGYACVHTATPGFDVHWAAPGADGVMAFAVEAPADRAYVSLGWSDSPGRMINGYAVIGWARDGAAAHVGMYKMDGRSASGVRATSEVTLTDASISVTGGRYVMRFSIDPARANAPAFRMLSATAENNMIWADGVANGAKGSFATHPRQGGFQMTVSGTVAVAATQVPATNGPTATATLPAAGGAAPAAPSLPACTASTLKASHGFDCMLAPSPSVKVHWKWPTASGGTPFAVEGPANAQYISLGWTDRAGLMFPGYAVIGWVALGVAPHVGAYRMSDRSAAGVEPSSDFALTDASIEASSGSYLMKFTVAPAGGRRRAQAGLPQLLSSNGLNHMLWAVGPSRTPGGPFGTHPLQGGFDLTLVLADAVPAGPNQGPQRQQGAPDTGGAAPTTPASGDRQAPAAPKCTASTLQGATRAYDCMQSVAAGVAIHWMLPRAESPNEVPAMAIEGPETSYISLGWGDSPGSMVPGYAVIGWADTGSNDPPHVGIYRMDGRSAGGVTPTTEVALSSASISVANGRYVMEFHVAGTAGAGAAARRRLSQGAPRLLDPLGANNMLYALGPAGAAKGAFRTHTVDGGFTLNLVTGATGSTGHPLHATFVAHGILGLLGFVVLFPVAVTSAALKQGFRGCTGVTTMPLWMDVHRAAAFLGPVFGGAAVALIVVKGNGGAGAQGLAFPTHRVLGWAVVAAGAANVLIGKIRPGKDHRYRTLWFLAHRVTGYGALAGGIAECFLGVVVMRDADDDVGGMLVALGATAATSAVLAAVLGVSMALLRRTGDAVVTHAALSHDSDSKGTLGVFASPAATRMDSMELRTLATTDVGPLQLLSQGAVGPVPVPVSDRGVLCDSSR
ncbi:unnamed protein product [Pedinophyceae sp. YPF-701]|nr:unnamed protein product [Pedinophyceae sp. YPF-701]